MEILTDGTSNAAAKDGWNISPVMVLSARKRLAYSSCISMRSAETGSRVVKSHICDKALKKQKQKFTEQAKNVAKPRPGKEEIDEMINSILKMLKKEGYDTDKIMRKYDSQKYDKSEMENY